MRDINTYNISSLFSTSERLLHFSVLYKKKLRVHEYAIRENNIDDLLAFNKFYMFSFYRSSV